MIDGLCTHFLAGMIERRGADALLDVAQTAPVEADGIDFTAQLIRRRDCVVDARSVREDGIDRLGRRQRMLVHHLHALLESEAEKLLLLIIIIRQPVVRHRSRHVQQRFHGCYTLLQVGNVHLQ